MQLKTFDPSETEASDPELSREECVAVLVMALPPEVGERVLEKIKPEQRVRLRERMNRFAQSPPPPESLNILMEELKQRMIAQRSASADRPRLAIANLGPSAKSSSEIESKAVVVVKSEPTSSNPPAEAATAPDYEEPPLDRDVLPKLKLWNVEQLVAAISGEPSNVVGIVLNCLDANKAGKVLKLLPADIGKEAFLSLMRSSPSGKVTIQVARKLMQKGKALSEISRDQPDQQSPEEKYKKVASLLRSMPTEIRSQMLQSLEQLDQEAAAKVKNQLYTFEDVLLLDDRSIQKVLRIVTTDLLSFALIGVDENILDKVLGNLSKRASETLQEELESRPSAPANKIEEGQQAVVQAILHFDTTGELTWES